METYLIAIIVFIVLLLLVFVLSAPAETPVVEKVASVDLDRGIPKYTKSGCEGVGASLSECPNGIASGTIKYGRWDNTICPHGTVNANTAAVFKEYPLTAGIKEIPGAINTFVKDDPLYGVAKHYYAEYIC
jgi:hypothetical protein